MRLLLYYLYKQITQRTQAMTTSREIKSALTKAFKGVKFSVTTRNVCCETVTVEWTGGPFINEVKAITEPWNTFEDHSDSMTDYFSYRGTEIKFERNLTQDEIEFLAVGILGLHGKFVDGTEIEFNVKQEWFRKIGDEYFYNDLTRDHNQSLREWKQNGLAVSLEESPQAIEAAYQAREKEIENARKEREEKRGELIQGDYDGTPADDNLDHIVIHNHEGFEFIEWGAKFKNFKSAHDAIVKCCEFHTDTNVGKMAFSVIFRDGYEYEGQMYLSPNEDHPSKTDNVIGDHCVDFLAYGAKHGSYGQGEGKEAYQELLDKYRFEDAPIESVEHGLIQGDYTEGMINGIIKYIEVNWHEGIEVIENGAKFATFKSFHEAVLKVCDINNENFANYQGYYTKLKFTMHYVNGSSEWGRLDLCLAEDNPYTTDNIIKTHWEDSTEYQQLEDATPADDVIVIDTTVTKRNATSDNNAIAAEWLLDDDHRENVLTIAQDKKVESVELHTMFTESATAKINESKESLLEKYSQWVAKKIALGQANKIVTFDDWQDIHTA